MIYNQVTIAQTGVRKSLGTGTIVGPFQIKALSDNSDSVYLGDIAVTSGNGFELGQGDTLTIMEDSSLTDIYVIGTANDKVCYISQSLA